jgi:hypothetical protein
MPIKNLNLSPIGDFFSISGDGVMSIWTRDSLNDYSYSNFMYFSREESKNILATLIKQKPIGVII